MPSASGIRAGAAFVELTVSDSRLIKGLRSASRRLQSFGAGLRKIGTRMTALGGTVVASLLASTKSFASMGDQLDKMSKRTGVSVEALSELGYAAKLSGASLEAVETGVRYMQRTIGEAATGSQMAADALALVRLSAKRLLELSPEDQFTVIGERLDEIADPARRASAAMEIFGRSGTALLPMMKGLAEARAEARRLGLVMSGEDARAAAVFNDALDRMLSALKLLTATVGSAIAPLLTELAGKIVRLVGSLRGWLAVNKGFIISALKIGVAIIAIGTAFIALGGIVSGIGSVFGLFASVVTGVLGFILSPVGMVIAAIAGLGSYILWATQTGGQALAWLSERFGDLKTFAVDAFQGIKDALAAGDIVLAARVLWLSLTVAWQTGIEKLKGWWIEFKGWFFQTTDEIFYGAVALVAEAWYGLRRIWSSTVNFWADILNRFAGFFLKTWNRLTGWFAKKWAAVAGIFDSSINVESVTRRIDEETRQQNVEISKNVVADQVAGERQLADIEKEREATLTAIGEAANRDDQARRAQYESQMQGSEAELARAKEEWRAALSEARDKRAAIDAGKPKDIQQKLSAAIPELDRAMKLDVIGTFSAEATDRMGTGPTAVEERTARASEETAKNTRKMTQQLEDGMGLVFA